MKNAKRTILLVVATSLAVVGLTGQAEIFAKKAVPDLNAKDSGSILMTIYCVVSQR